MVLVQALAKLFEYKLQIALQLVLVSLAYLLIRYRRKVPSARLELGPEMKKKLIAEYEPLPLITSEATLLRDCQVTYNFCNYDVFGLNGQHKEAIKDAIREYGVGTCGPRGFYGTLNIHLELEDKLAKIYQKESAVLYSNYFAAMESICACFCVTKNTVYFQKTASEAILRGLCSSHASIILFEDLEDLASKLSVYVPDRYVVVEKISKNSGKAVDLRQLVEMRSKYGFRLILDESFAFPFLYQVPFDIEYYKDVDIIVGSLAHGYPAGGGFSCRNIDVVDHQRINSKAYTFSASLPGFLARAALCYIDTPLDYTVLARKIEFAHKSIEGIVSAANMPVLLVKCEDAARTRLLLRNNGYVVGLSNGYLRLCVGVEVPDKHIAEVGKLIRKYSGIKSQI